MSTVIDASVMVSYLINDEDSLAADSLLSQLNGAPIQVPSIWVYEIASAFRSAELSKRVTAQEAGAAMNFVRLFPAEHHHPNVEVIAALAREQVLTVYDSSYLALCLRDGLPLATHDRKLADAAHRLGIRLLI